MRSLAEPLRVGMDNGVRRASVLLEDERNFLEVSGEIVERVEPVFFSDPITAAMKGLGIVSTHLRQAFFHSKGIRMTPKQVEQACEQIKQHLQRATKAKADGDNEKMQSEAETAAMIFVPVISEAHDPYGMVGSIEGALHSFGFSEEQIADLLVTKRKRKQPKKNDAAGTTKAPANVPLPHLGPRPAPKFLAGFPNAKPDKRKTPVQGGGHLRRRWKDSKKKRIYEWDSQHGEVEEWDWTGKKHLGSYDPDGKHLKGPDATKNPITPTINKPMNFTTTFGLYWFASDSDELVGEEDLPELKPEEVREWFFLASDEPLTDSFIVRASQRKHLAKQAKAEIDLNKYDYFIECFLC